MVGCDCGTKEKMKDASPFIHSPPRVTWARASFLPGAAYSLLSQPLPDPSSSWRSDAIRFKMDYISCLTF